MKQLSTKRFSQWTTYFSQWIQRRFDSLKAVVTGVKTDVAAVAGDAAAAKDDAHNLAQFFGVPEALPEEYQPMAEKDVTDTLEDIMGSLDLDLNETVEYPEGSGTYMTRAQAITAQANEIIHPIRKSYEHN